ncbi:unnamed protein product [Lactuca virosa]|uniref:Uncharacterized protein n=1 Tax=Lactuca virosa TaxID=75947 RepID=A0AAU9MTU7_9ASTR|nr:unnamed protein product [Lactuca virosa]
MEGSNDEEEDDDFDDDSEGFSGGGLLIQSEMQHGSMNMVACAQNVNGVAISGPEEYLAMASFPCLFYLHMNHLIKCLNEIVSTYEPSVIDNEQDAIKMRMIMDAVFNVIVLMFIAAIIKFIWNVAFVCRSVNINFCTFGGSAASIVFLGKTFAFIL